MTPTQRGTAAEQEDAVRVVVAPDSFKGSLPATEVAESLAAGLRRSGTVVPDVLPIADGGEGTVDAAVAAGFAAVELEATGPLGESRPTRYALRDGTAVVEMAAVCGLDMVEPTPATALAATSRGVGEIIGHALDNGARTIVLAVGGSATTDGGAGMLSALGARLLLDPAGHGSAATEGGSAPDDGAGALSDGGGALADLASVDLTGLDPRLRAATVILANDVDNPLLGPAGAAQVYGPQKGADAAAQARLEGSLARWVQGLAAAGLEHAETIATRPGAGAAGGMGFAALCVLGASARPGIEVVLELIDFKTRVPDAALVVTGEGSLDTQTLRGKAPIGVARAAQEFGVPTVAVCGRTELTGPELRAAGLTGAYALTTFEPDVQRCMREPGPILTDIGAQIARDLPRLTAAS